MSVYAVYGLLNLDIEGAKEMFEALLGVQFEARSSDYHGGDYFFNGDRYHENFLLKNNIDLVDGEAAEPKFSEYQILLYVNDTLRWGELQRIIDQEGGGPVLLRCEFSD